MTANVSIETAKAANTLRIPVAALRFTPPEDLIEPLSFDRSVLTVKKTLNSGTVWPARGNDIMPPVQVETGITDGKWVQLISEKGSAARPPRPDRQSGKRQPEGESRPQQEGQPRSILREGTELVVNAQKGAANTTQSRGLFGGPGGGRRGGGPR